MWIRIYFIDHYQEEIFHVNFIFTLTILYLQS